jgi:hypothetical protein
MGRLEFIKRGGREVRESDAVAIEVDEVSCRGMRAAFVEPVITATTREAKATRQYIIVHPNSKERKELTTRRGNARKEKTRQEAKVITKEINKNPVNILRK